MKQQHKAHMSRSATNMDPSEVEINGKKNQISENQRKGLKRNSSKKTKTIDEIPEAEEQKMSRTEKGRLQIVQGLCKLIIPVWKEGTCPETCTERKTQRRQHPQRLAAST
jgi:hypothetical protein